MPANMPATIGRYTLAGEIGRGAMGVVYKAADPALERTVAIKTVGLDLDPAEREQYEKRFITEARAAGGLNHPNIVVIHDIGKSEELAFIAMEYLEGRELKELIATRELSADRALDIAAQVADALAYAHRRDIVHRDVKPANIMILTDGRVKITDFGIARMRSSDVRSPAGVVVGSPRYLSPEQVLGKRSDARADSFALGVILYEMLTGDVPFNGIDVNALMFQIVHFNPPPPSHINPALPAVIDLIIAKALAKNPDDRYADIGEFAADMKQARLPGLADVYVPAAAGPGVMTAQPLSETWIETLPSGRTGDFDIIQAADAGPGAWFRFDGRQHAARRQDQHTLGTASVCGEFRFFPAERRCRAARSRTHRRLHERHDQAGGVMEPRRLAFFLGRCQCGHCRGMADGVRVTRPFAASQTPVT